MAISKERKHIMNRLGALIKNLERAPENFPLDKQLSRMIDKLEGRMRHMRDQAGYREIARKRRLDAERAAAKEASDAAVEEENAARKSAQAEADEAAQKILEEETIPPAPKVMAAANRSA